MEALLSSLSGYIGQNWDDNSDAIDAIIHGAGFVYRWLEPDTELAPNDTNNRPDRINIHVDANMVVQNYTVG